MWAILSREDTDGNRWDAEEFFATGRAEIDRVLDETREHAAIERGRALDFGCGVGRLSQALARHFGEVHGVDIAASMIERARAFEQSATTQREAESRVGTCEFHLNERPSLALFPDGHFDFIYSNITLQHMAPALAHGYLREFCRVLAPSGVLVFQLPTRPRIERSRAARLGWNALRSGYRLWRRRVKGEPVMDMFGTSQPDVEALLLEHGCRVVHSEQGEMDDWYSVRYCAVRSETA